MCVVSVTWPNSDDCCCCCDCVERAWLKVGYGRLQYLLANWDAQTTVCIKGCKGAYESCGCVRDPVVVQAYMGYKSMEDPLFRAGDLMLRAQGLVSDADFDKYNNAMERWNEKARMCVHRTPPSHPLYM